MLYSLLLQAAVPDWSQFGLDLIQLITPLVTTLAIQLAKSVVGKIPKTLIPLVAVILGMGVDFLLAQSTGGAFHPVLAALLGAAAVWLYEFTKSLNETVQNVRSA